jgi:hypothetical protein
LRERKKEGSGAYVSMIRETRDIPFSTLLSPRLNAQETFLDMHLLSSVFSFYD